MIADALSVLRLLLAVPFALAMREADFGAAVWSGLLVSIAIATDLLDGRIARRLGTVSTHGRALDHGADVAIVLAGLCGAASRGAVPWLLPLLVGMAFAQYAFDSFLVHRQRTLRMSSLGRWNGILYFVPIVGDVLVRLGLPAGSLVRLIAWGLVVTTLLSMADRLRAPLSGRTAPGSPSEGTEDRSPR